MKLNESTVEDASLTWLAERSDAVGHRPQGATGEVALAGHLREAIRRLHPTRYEIKL